MRYVYLAAIVALSVSIPSVSNGQSAPFSITNYQLVSRQQVSSSLSSITYRAELANPGPAAAAVTATVSSRSPRISVVPGQRNLHFSAVPANGGVASSDTFTILADNNAPFDPTDLHWSFTAPVANAGPGQTAGVSSTVTLDGSGSTNPSANGTLTYYWEFTSRPAGSGARLDNEKSAMPSFVVDVPGDYAIALTVSNSAETDSATVKVSTINTPPVANAGPNQTVAVGATVIHNGSGSSDVDGNALTYSWTLVTKPAGSAATLSAASTVSPTFAVDKPGMYVAQLVVNDGLAGSAPSTVTITTQNTPPVANTGRAQLVTTGALVQLNGAGSTDVDGNPLTYSWSLITMPAGSKAVLSNLTAVNPAFTADVPGTYVAQLIVNDGFVDSTPQTVTITTNAVQGPLANAGPNQTVTHNSTVVLSGSGADLQGLPLTYQLALISKPAGSNAVLSSANSPNATFVADLPGTYIAQLIVNNGVLSSPPATVTITTTNTPPVAHAGRSQNVGVGANVQLDASASYDADRDPLTHIWSFTSRPNGSTATLFNLTGKSPMFVADVAGTYVVQLIVNDGYTNGDPSTVTITASAAPAITLTPNRLNLGRDHGTLTVSLSAPAGEGGQEVNLAISDGDVASVPARITIPQGSTGANVKVPRGIKGGNATITASAMSFASATAEVVGTNTIVLPTATVAPGQKVAFPVTLASAPASTVFVTLSSSDTTKLTFSATTLVFDAGSMTPTSTPQLDGVALGSVTITASATNFTTVSETIQVAANIAFVPSTLTVSGFITKNLNLVLSSAAPAGGQTINLTSTNTSIATVPATVTIAANTTNVSVPVTGVAFGTTTINASAATLANTSATVTVAGAGTVNLPASASVGNLQSATFPISLSSAAPAGGMTVTLSSTDITTLTISPASVTIAAGSTTPSTQPTITGVAVGSATINASAPGYTSSSLLVPVNNVQMTLPSFTSVGLTASTSFPVTLATPAPAGGLTVTLTSSNTSTVSVSSSVTVAAGATTPTTQPQVKGVNVGSANITATAPGYISAAQPVSVTAGVSVTPSTISVAATASATLTLTLSAAAPTGGVTVNLASNNTGVATVPATVTFAAGSKTATFAVAGVAAGSTTITAGAPPNVPNATLTVTVTPPGTIGTPSGLSVALAQSASFPITLSTPAPTGGVTVTLTSDNASTVSISPSTVQIAANAVTPTTQPQVTGVNLGLANITASAPGYTSATQPVNGIATVTLSPSTSTVGLNSSQNLTLTLSAKAPAGGLTVNLNSTNTSLAMVQPTASFSAGATTAPVPVTALGNIGSATIQASAPGIPMATANVTVAQLPLILLPSSITVALGKTASLGISLQTAAPAGGVTVTLTSSNGATVSPSSLTFAAGQANPTTQPNVTGVNFAGATISATATGYASASVPVLVNTTAALSPTSATIIGTNTSTFTITLGASAPAGGVTITLNSSTPAVATVPASVTIATGTSATFAVTGVAPGTTTITASAPPNIGSVTANVTVNPLGTITLNPATPGLGQTAAFPISISPVAPTGGVTIALSSSNTAIAKTSVTTVTIPAGMSSPTSSPSITGVNLGSATITASATNYTTATQQAQVTATVTVTPLSLVVGNTGNMTLKLSAAAPAGGITVNLGSSDTTIATVPATATFGVGQSTITVPVTAVAVGTVTIDASNPTGIADATGTVTVNPPGIISIPSAPTVGLKSSTQFPITLLTPAPTGGVTLTLSSSNTSMVTVSPASITIAAGGTSPTVQPTITGANIGSANVTVSAPNYITSTAAAQVTGTLTSITPASPLIYGTATQTFTLTLSTTAPTGGITLNLSSSNTGVATVPATVTIPANSNSATFVATGVAAGQTTITAGLPPNIANISTSLTDSNPGTITLNPLSLGKGQAGQFQILLTPAPPVNTTVTLSSSNTSIATVTSSVTVTAGSGTPTTQPTVTGINFGSATITASAFGYVTASEAVPVGDTITFPSNTLTITGSGTQNLSLTLSAPAPAGGFVINLSSSNSSVATVQSTVTFTQGSTSVNVPVTAPGLTFGTTTITAQESPNIVPTTATVTVQSAGTIQIAPTTVTLGSPATFNVSLPAPATSNVTVSLTSSNTSVATISPASVTIAAGNTTPTTQPKVTGVNLGSVNVTASAAGYTAGVQPVTSIATVSYSPSSLTIVGGAGTGTFKLTLSGAAPSGGLTVNLSSSDTTIATVPASATFAAGQTTATFTVTGVAAGAATITASNAAGIAATTANVTVTPPGTITLASNVTPGLGQAQTLAVTLNPAAPTGGTTVTLSSSNTSIATVTSTATVAAGLTTPTTQPKVTGIAYGTVTITASAPGYVTTTQTVQVIDSVSFTPNTVTITGPSAGTLTLTLSAPAPAAGITVNLTSSNASVATVPATTTFTSGKTTVSIPVTGLNIGSTVIDASSSPNIADTTATVTVQTAGQFTMPAATSVNLGGTASYAVKIPIAAPTGGVTVSLTSSNPAITVPATFTIPAGSTQASVAPKLTGANIGSATITASAPGFTTTTSAVNTVIATVTLPTSTLNITGPKTSNITATLSAVAPTGGVTINVISSNIAVATVPATVTFAAGSNTTTIPVTATGPGAATITTSLSPNIPNATANVSVTTQGTILIPSNVSVPLGQSIPYNVTLQAGAPSPGITVNLASSDPTKVSISPASVFIAANATAPATQPQVTGVNIGSVTMTASSSVYTTGSQTASVTATVTPSPTSLTINGLGSANLTLTLSVNAPSGGVTINLSSSNTTVATVPSTATFQPGSNTVTVPVTSANVGTATITAGLSGSIPNVTVNVTVTSIGNVILGPAVSLMAGQSGALAVSLSAAAPAGGVTVQLATSNTSLATVSPSSVFIAQGSTTPATQPQVNGISVGTVNITGTAPGFTAATPITAAVNDTIGFPSGTTIIQLPAKATSFTQNITLTLTVPVPTPVTLNLSSSSTNVATVPSTVTIPANATSVLVPVTGKSGAAGAVTIHANKSPNIPDVAASVFVKNPAVGTITIAPVSVGKGLEAQIAINLSAPQATDTNVTIYTSDPSKALIAGRVADPGASSVVATVAAGLTSAGGIYVQGLVSSGTVQIYTLTTNFVDANATVTLQPSGFVLSTGPSTIGTPSFVVFQGTTTPLTVSAAMLNSSLNFLAVQPVANGSTPTVNVTSSNTSLGTISTSPLTFTAGVSSQTTNFVAASTSSNSAASVTLNVSAPSGFSTPAQDTSLTATIDATGMTATNATVGNGLETTAQVTLEGVAPVATVVTIKSPLSSVLFSTTSTGTGSTQIQITIPQGFTHTPPFYVYGAANSGTVTYTASAPNFNQTTGTVTLQPAGFVMQGPLGLGSSSFPASVGTTQGITVIAAMLNSGGGYVAQQAVAGAGSVTVNLTSSNTMVGTITSPVVIAGGTSNNIATFTPLSSGTTSLTLVGTPAGFSTPSVDTQINASIAAPSAQVTSGVTVGNQLALQGTVNLSQAPASNETVTLTVTSGNMLLAVNPTDAGSGSIQITIAAGSTTGNYYIYGLASSGTAGYSATASGYTSGSGTVTLAPSGVVLAAPSGLGLLGFTASVGTPQTLTVYTCTLNPAQSNKSSVVEQLAGFVVNGVTATINDLSGGAFGTLSPNPVTIPAGASSANVTFMPTVDTPPKTTFELLLATPSGFTTSGNDTSLQVSVSN
jgi:hypothetical protein